MITAKIGIPANLLVRIASIWSCLFFSLVKILRFSTSFTISFTKAKRFLSAASTSALLCKSISSCIYTVFCPAPFKETAFSTTSFKPLLPVWMDTVLITGQPIFSERSSRLISVSFFSLISLLFRATTTGIPSSRSCVVKNRLRLRLVASTMLIIASGCSFFT